MSPPISILQTDLRLLSLELIHSVPSGALASIEPLRGWGVVLYPCCRNYACTWLFLETNQTVKAADAVWHLSVS